MTEKHVMRAALLVLWVIFIGLFVYASALTRSVSHLRAENVRTAREIRSVRARASGYAHQARQFGEESRDAEIRLVRCLSDRLYGRNAR